MVLAVASIIAALRSLTMLTGIWTRTRLYAVRGLGIRSFSRHSLPAINGGDGLPCGREGAISGIEAPITTLIVA